MNMIYPLNNSPANLFLRESAVVFGKSEDAMAKWWRSLTVGIRLKTLDGTPVYLLESGVNNIYNGPDILGAKLIIGSKVKSGDIEFHLNEQDWIYHGHSTDPYYNNVILHVVNKLGSKRAVTVSGKQTPTMIWVDDVTIINSGKKCKLSGELDSTYVEKVIQTFLWSRWIEKNNRFYREINTDKTLSDIFYAHTFRALGFKGNTDKFERLSGAYSLPVLSHLKNSDDLKTAIFGTAGLTPPNYSSKKVFKKKWESIVRKYKFKRVIEAYEWNTRSVRPAAHPAYRLMFGVEVIKMLLSDWQPWLEQKPVTYRYLKILFPDSLPGKGWVSEWIGNVILPMQEAVRMNGRFDQSDYFDQWRKLRLGYIYGKLSRQFASHIPKKELTGFAMQQGLLSFQQRYCSEELCGVCPLRS